MTYSIRKYQPFDFKMVANWWKYYKLDLHQDLIPLDTSYILMNGDEAIMFGCLYLIQGTRACFIENIVSNPGSNRELALELMFDHLYKVARRHQRTSVIVFTPNEKLKERYMQCGMTPAMNNVHVLCKMLE